MNHINKQKTILLAALVLSFSLSLPAQHVQGTLAATDEALLERLQRETFNYFWEGGEPISGGAPERIHLDNEYPQSDADVVASGGTGFGIMATIVAIERGFVSKDQARVRLTKLAQWLKKADRFHGAWSHWIYPSGKVKPFSRYDDGGDLVETAYLAQGLIVAREYFKTGNAEDKKLAALLDELWKGIDWNWYTRGEKVIYWHWSPQHEWKMNFAVTGYNECTILYVLGASSPTHPVDPACFHEGYMRNGEILTNARAYGLDLVLEHNSKRAIPVGPLFWAHYSFLGLDPQQLTDSYADYWQLNRNHALVHYRYCVDNPLGYEGYGEDCWGLTASYSQWGYSAHMPSNDLGVISPTAALSSIPYTPEESMRFLKHLYRDHPEYLGKYGPYDAFSEASDWMLPRYLAIDQLPIPVMVENYRSGLIWRLFMQAPEIKAGLQKLDIHSGKY